MIGTPYEARWRRALLFTLVTVSTLFASYWMFDVVESSDRIGLNIVTTVLFAINFAWIDLAFWTAMIGVFLRFTRRDPISLEKRPARLDDGPLATRNAIVMPIYNEDPHRVFAGLEAVWRSLVATGQADAFDLYILSDTRAPDVAEAEELGWKRLCHRVGGSGRIFYRRRPNNHGKKAGNVADFCTRWGARYESMIVLDADSVMSGDAMVRLVRIMDASPHVGMVQTLPIAVNRETFFARFVQFATRLNGPVLSTGLAFWTLGEGNYWGHNAIIRIAPFMKHCGLPTLPGPPPFGGEILSHDFVEAALMLRGGWSVWLLPDLGGSYEEVPTNLLDYVARDRRWCQGNLQHTRLLGARGLLPLSRLHLVMGVFAYVSPLLWCLLLGVSMVEIVYEAVVPHEYFSAGPSLFPRWPVSRTFEQLALYCTSLGLLLVPKTMAMLLAMLDREERRGFGGAPRLLFSTLVEVAFAMLLAPVMMLFHATMVLATLCRRTVSWGAQARSDRGLTWREAARRHAWHSTIGLAIFAVLVAIAPQYLVWLAPVLVGLMSSIFLSWVSSRAAFGKWVRARGVFTTPEESAPPMELRMLYEALERPEEEALEALPEPTRVPPPRMRAMPPQAFDAAPSRPAFKPA